MSEQYGAAQLNRVRIPSELHADVCRFFSELQQLTLRLAVAHADARTSDDERCILQAEDVAMIGQSALAACPESRCVA